ncbi:MAG: hypothetical protein WBO09_01765 [Methylocystis silviterrae]|uniref:hypothetical protein n=1 Tax=Methylocystis silviterrae TaxID=2743612 RepID=UPI003C746026
MKTLNNPAIPAAIARMLRTPPLEPHAFAATKFHSAEDKAWFGNAFLKFLADDCPQSAFTKRFYNRLSHSFGHIAHYNRAGFYEHFFVDLAGKIDFLQQTLQWPCYGQPEHTFSDVELVLQARLSTATLLPLLIARRNADIARRERDLLARLKAKYEPQPQPYAPTMALRQASLFDLSA